MYGPVLTSDKCNLVSSLFLEWRVGPEGGLLSVPKGKRYKKDIL